MMMIYDLSELVTELHGASYSNNHKAFGWAIMFSSTGWVVSGVVAFMARKLLKWDTKTIQYIRYTHRIIAMTFWAIAIYTMYIGMILYLEKFGTYEGYLNWKWFIDFSLAT